MEQLQLPAATAVMADLRSRGIGLETDGVRLRWRPKSQVTGARAQQLLAQRDEMIEILRTGWRDVRCPVRSPRAGQLAERSTCPGPAVPSTGAVVGRVDRRPSAPDASL